MLRAKLGKIRPENSTETHIRKNRLSRKGSIEIKHLPRLTTKISNDKQKPPKHTHSPVTAPAVEPKTLDIKPVISKQKLNQAILNQKMSHDLNIFQAKINTMALVDENQDDMDDQKIQDPLVKAEIISFLNVRGRMDSLEHTEYLAKLIEPNQKEHTIEYLQKLRVTVHINLGL
jgi:hypothetical protein